MHETKALLIEKNGLRCMLCGRDVTYREINWHHIVPRYQAKREGREPDNSYENGSLLCLNCHSYVHSFDYKDPEYQALMKKVNQNKKPR